MQESRWLLCKSEKLCQSDNVEFVTLFQTSRPSEKTIMFRLANGTGIEKTKIHFKRFFQSAPQVLSCFMSTMALLDFVGMYKLQHGAACLLNYWEHVNMMLAPVVFTATRVQREAWTWSALIMTLIFLFGFLMRRRIPTMTGAVVGNHRSIPSFEILHSYGSRLTWICLETFRLWIWFNSLSVNSKT